MESFNQFLLALDGVLGSAPWFPWVLLGVGLFFTIYLGFPQIRYFGHAVKIVQGKYDKPGDPGDTSHFQALSTALSGTVGTGNIGGVGLAIFLGGPAALFWMWVTAFLGMTTKFVEVTLSHKYRIKAADGYYAGGPMFFMERRLNMKWLAVLFAIATVICSFGTGSLPQVNNIAQAMHDTFGLNKALTGGILAILLGMVIIGGISRIAKVTSTIVPVMAVLYVIGALAVIIYNYQNIIPSFLAVFEGAFTGSAATGGFLGATFAYAFNRGVNRGLFSNEAGQGSAPIAHAAARADEPVSEGMVSLLEPFIDTIVICTLTGLVILSSGVWTEKHMNKFERADMVAVAGTYTDSNPEDVEKLFKFLSGGESDVQPYSGSVVVADGLALNEKEFTLIHARSVAEDVEFRVGEDNFSGVLTVVDGRFANPDVDVWGKSLVHSVALTNIAFQRGFFGDYGSLIVTLGILLFAFSTAIAWSYYGDRSMIYLFGPRAVMPYRLVYVVAFFWAAIEDTTVIWNLSAVAIVIMTLPNLFGISVLAKEMKDTVKEYWRDPSHK
ncbi:alanine/glycine:cation symporter family protein [Microbulbifer thermotolerans]|uniref:Alanine glycine permease n=1 Tax=Microbulbifer thermotolerans TaxID=252514 RepID=A0A143HLB9_MICTH|nr:amino acid carrier protein [Microbulbifer thermotolerans]AMX02509.1 alanine glycine permease [Microbulbifer thermotolerans]MCX2779365.1 amino acid carrier protein [Microbulbifer thermotolerans]MCX2782431.1 amino acid carrier protein [Microbulbifer thermotolerans]MCX2795016.1 amino acid carrier protein [Microbulbifer thermotolerans]MCX2800584.1 amino acid carrier protein [Microbulbifer thermotolerans]